MTRILLFNLMKYRNFSFSVPLKSFETFIYILKHETYIMLTFAEQNQAGKFDFFCYFAYN